MKQRIEQQKIVKFLFLCQLTSHWLVVAACPVHCHTSNLCVVVNSSIYALYREASTHEKCSMLPHKEGTANSLQPFPVFDG